MAYHPPDPPRKAQRLHDLITAHGFIDSVACLIPSWSGEPSLVRLPDSYALGRWICCLAPDAKRWGPYQVNPRPDNPFRTKQRGAHLTEPWPEERRRSTRPARARSNRSRKRRAGESLIVIGSLTAGNASPRDPPSPVPTRWTPGKSFGSSDKKNIRLQRWLEARKGYEHPKGISG